MTIRRCKCCATRAPLDTSGWAEMDGKLTCPKCQAELSSQTAFDLTLYAQIPTQRDELKRDDLVLYSQSRSAARIYRIKAAPKERSHGWQVCVQRMDTSGKSSGYLYFRPDEPAVKLVRKT